ncbi:riboflavin kinase isoform X2 [Aethina tumida]|uniref:riboflavin kinase isoform X2 n=1 Tax=Aethina tumida TaxID=116153 RepID=UPI002147CFA0|nr:riboflavin kinase isoform X2 [Aethina tumida]
MLCEKMSGLPHYAVGEVVKGFGRGSKDLGIPTANYPESVVDNLPESIKTGVYCGFASVDNNKVHKMVISIGWNPTYGNTKKSMETHIIDMQEGDFYGKTLKIAIVKYIRDELKFTTLQDLIDSIHNDIKYAKDELDKPDYEKIKNDNFFKS